MALCKKWVMSWNIQVDNMPGFPVGLARETSYPEQRVSHEAHTVPDGADGSKRNLTGIPAGYAGKLMRRNAPAATAEFRKPTAENRVNLQYRCQKNNRL